MTLILARASSKFVLQVTDRLVTLNTTKEPHDLAANKNILYFASNAVVAITYTGDAYVEGVPTDHWIAEKLAGIKINLEVTPTTSFHNEPHRDVGQALGILKNELDRRARRIHDLLIPVQGWQWDSKGRLRPLLGDIRKTSLEKAFSIHYEERNWYLKGYPMTLAAPPSNISQKELADLSNRLRHKSAVEAEGLLVDKIRDLSQRNSIIGPHCMSILLPPPSNPNILVRYIPADPSTLSKSQRLDENQKDWAYTPWILGRRMCIPPSQIIGGGFTARNEPFSIQFISETPEHPDWSLLHQGQKRPPPP